MLSSRITVSLLLAASLLTSACGKREEVARVGDRKIEKAEFEAFLRYKRVVSDDPKRLERALDEYLERSALAQAVESEKLLDATELAVELDELKKEMLLSRYFEKFLNEKVGEDAVRNYYDAHLQDYEEKKVHAAHILVRTSESMDDTARKAALTRAQEAYSKIRAGAAFDATAQTYSEDRLSGPKGGDLGWIKSNAIDPRFAAVMTKLKPGEVSEPFLTQFGYHVVKVLEGPTTLKQPLEAVSGDIRYLLRQQAKAAELKRLTAKVETEKNAAVLKTIKTTRPSSAVAKDAKK
jgi:peptidyl-prolyl cis-trans isomerase C